MEEEKIILQYRFTQIYLETARAAFTSIYLPSSLEELIEKYGFNPLVNANFSLTSITIVYSYMAIEAFINYQFILRWNKKNDGSRESKNFLQLFGNVKNLNQLRKHKNFWELPKRIKSYCSIMEYGKIHETNPKLWQDFNEVCVEPRNFIIHPSPDRAQEMLELIEMKTIAGKYVEVAEGIIKHIYNQGRLPIPEWLNRNTLFQFKGLDLLTGRNKAI